ncbi:MAG: DUF4153 domain-containing protein [Bacteroidales bacterium]|nr:DUF4153 domain-containing protein [Bacteroidales bacterium]
MKNYLPELKSYFSSSIKSNKIELLTSIITLLFVIYITIFPLSGFFKGIDNRISTFFILGILIENLLNKKDGNFKFLYYISFLPYLFLVFFNLHLTFDTIFELYALVGLIFLSSPFEKDNVSFSNCLFEKVANIIVTLLFSLFIWIILNLLVESITSLFSIKITHQSIKDTILLSTVFYGFLPIIYFYISKINNELAFIKQPFFKTLANYILTPTLILYTIIFYAYIIRIAILGELPKGMIAIMTLVFFCFAIAGKMYGQISSYKSMTWFYKYLNIICIPIIILYSVSVYIRIYNYGFTNDRILLIAFGLLLLIFCSVFFLKNLSHWRILSSSAVVLMSVSLVLSFIPSERMLSWYKGHNSNENEPTETKIVNLISADNKIDIENYSSLIKTFSKNSYRCKDVNNYITYNYYVKTGDLFFYDAGSSKEIGHYIILPVLKDNLKSFALKEYKEDKTVYNIMLPDSLFSVELSQDTVAVFNNIEFKIDVNNLSNSEFTKIDDCILLIKK